MRDRLLIDTVFGNALALHPRELNKLAMVVSRHAAGQTVDADAVRDIVAGRGDSPYHAKTDGEPYRLEGAVAVIGVGGVIAKHASQVNGSSQPRGTSTDTLRAAYAAALNDARVGSVLFHIESPGGTVDGLEALAQDIAAGRGNKPTVAVASGLMASAAYWIGAQASRVYTETATDEIGSIGVYTVLEDWSRYLDNQGIKVDVVRSAPLKGIGAAGASISPEQRADVQRRIDELRTQFVQAVARGRGVSMDRAESWATGQTWGGNEALAMGLIDGIQRAEQVIADLNSKYPARAGSTKPRATGSVPGAAGKPAATAAKEQDMKTFGHVLRSPDGAEGGGMTAESNQNQAAGGATERATDVATEAAAPAKPSGTATLQLAGHMTRADVLGVQAIRKLYGSDQAIAALIEKHEASTSFNLSTLQREVAEQVGKGYTPASAPVSVGASGRDTKRRDIENAQLAKYNPGLKSALYGGGAKANRTARIMGFDSPELALRSLESAESSGLHVMRLGDIITDRLSAFNFGGNRTVRTERDFMAAGAMGSSDFPLLLSNLQNKNLQLPFDEAPLVWNQIALVRPVSDFKDINVLRASGVDNLRLILEGRLPEQTTFNERGEKYAVAVYGIKTAVTFQMVRNDDLGELMRLTTKLRNSARRLPEDLLFAQLVSGSGFTRGPVMAGDSNNRLWCAAHANIANPVAALSYDSVVAGKVAMARQKSFGPSAEPLNVQAEILLVPPELEDAAVRLYTGEFRPQSGTNASDPNTLKGRFRPVSTPRMTAAAAWALFAGPNSGVHAFEVAFLDGRQDPYINEVPQTSMLQMEWECIMPGVGVTAANWEGTYWNTGA